MDLTCSANTGPRTRDSDPDPPTSKTRCLGVMPAAGKEKTLTLAHSVSLSRGQLMGERTSTAPRGVLPQ